MKEIVKNILKRLHIYHPLQSSYRSLIFSFRNKLYRWQYRKYAGPGFTCNVCGAIYKKFVPDNPEQENREALTRNGVIAGYGKNILCPNCMSTARERLVIAMLKDKLHVQGKKILHLSPEKNVFKYLQPQAEVVTTDLEPGFYKTIDQTIQKQDATSFGFSNNSFDMVIANHVLEHIPNDRKAIQEIYRLLKPGSYAVLQVPFSETLAETIESPGIKDPAAQSKLYGQKDHVRVYALNDYINRLKMAGFLVEMISYVSLSPYYSNAIQEGEHFLLIQKPA